MQVQTEFLRLSREVAIGDHIDGWRVCWVGGIKGDLEGALPDLNEVIRLQPDNADTFYNRSLTRKAKGDIRGAAQDSNEAIRLRYKPE